MIVSSILENKPKDLVSATPDMTIHEAAQLLSEYKIGAVIVKDGETLAGILSERDIVKELSVSAASCLAKTVGELMTRTVKTTTPDTSLTDVLGIMTGGRFRHMPVLDNGAIVGIVSIGDIVKFRLQELEAEATDLRGYVSGGY